VANAVERIAEEVGEEAHLVAVAGPDLAHAIHRFDAAAITVAVVLPRHHHGHRLDHLPPQG
jgi:hypothetical protein